MEGHSAAEGEGTREGTPDGGNPTVVIQDHIFSERGHGGCVTIIGMA